MSAPITLDKIAAAVVTLATVLVAAPALGAGFALQENSGSGLGNAYAGGAAAAEDASTVWSNAAGMARLGSAQFAGAVNLIQPSMKFSNAGSQNAALQPLGSDGGDAGSLNVVPNLYVTVPIDPRWTLGLGINAPFGLVSEYDGGWIGRFQGLKSEIKTINLNPAVSWKAADAIAIGFGANYQKMDGTFTSNVNYSGVLFDQALHSGLFTQAELGAIAAGTAGLVSDAKVEGSDHAWGWNLGVLIDLDKASRVGLQYRSAVKYTLSGNAEFANPALPAVSGLSPTAAAKLGAVAAGVNGSALYDSGITSQVELPAIVNLSYFGAIHPQWDVMADLQYTGWGSIQNLAFVRSDGTGTELQSTALNFDDAWRFAIGANYRYSERWLFRGGLAYDQTPVQDADRTVRLPDSDRTWLTLGAQYKFNAKLWLDFGGAYIWVRSGSIDNIGASNLGAAPSASLSGRVKGDYGNSVVVLSGQLTYAF
jgi:long-chain fatty acid transport protein